MKATGMKQAKDTMFSGMGDPKASIAGSAGATFSTLPNINKQKKGKLIMEANPMVH
jgi:hypothetical protein